MVKCQTCGEETKNKKYCSKECLYNRNKKVEQDRRKTMKFKVVNSTAQLLMGFYFEYVKVPRHGDVINLCKMEECKKYGTPNCERNSTHKNFEIINSTKVGKNYKFSNSNVTLICRRVEKKQEDITWQR